MEPTVAMLRIAALSVQESARMVDELELDDPIARLAIQAAVGPDLLAAAATKPRAEETAVRYLARMGGRATPYGLFAGTAMVPIAADRHLELSDRSEHRVRTRVDITALETVVGKVLDRAGVDAWPLRVNPLARSDGPLLRFARPGDASADVVTVKATPVIAKVLELLGDRLRRGGAVVAELIAWRPELTPDQLRPLLVGLVDSGLLERAAGLLQPGVEPVQRAIAVCQQLDAGEVADALATLAHDVAGTPTLSPVLQPAWDHSWEQATKVVESFAAVPQGKRYDHQLELATVDSRLDRKTLDGLLAAASRVQQVNATAQVQATERPGWSPELSLDRFRQAFRLRYEDAEVPLLAAVDLESGVLQSPRRQLSTLAIEAGIVTETEGSPAAVPPGALTAYRRFTWSHGPVDIADFAGADELTSRAISAVLLDSYEGTYTAMLVGAIGRSPFALMARFGLGRPEVADAFTAQLAAERALPLAAEFEPDPIRAEVVYDPGGRIGNVLVRPKVFADTIALTGGAGGTLSLDRLTLRLERDTLRLRDQVTGRPVVVELNSAHNADFFGLDPVYAVLGRLAGSGGGGWSWGGLEGLDHLPRITCGPVIVAPEQWQLTGEQVRDVRAAENPGVRLRQEIGLDDHRRWLGVGSLDHILPIDLTSARSVRAALARIRPDESARLVEMPQAEAPATTSPTGGHVTEVVVGLGPALRPALRAPQHDIVYCPEKGAHWVYARYHCGQSSAEQVIARAAALSNRLVASGVVDDWFFVRYAEDGYHVRVRWHATSAEVRERVLVDASALGARLRSEGLAGRMVIDDYVPEVTRYGGSDNLPLAERLFTLSSDRVAAFLATQPSEELRLYRAVSDTLAWTERLRPDRAEQLHLLQACQQGLQVRFSRSGNRHGKLLRNHRQGLEDHLAQAAPDLELLSALERLADAVSVSPGPDRLRSVIGSCLHMHCNRMFAFDAVRLEYLTYECAIRKTRERGARSGGVRSGGVPAGVAEGTTR